MLLSFMIMKNLFKEGVDCPRPKSVGYAVSVLLNLCFLKLCGLLLGIDTWMLETCFKLQLKVVLFVVLAEYLFMVDKAKNSVSNNSSEENTKNINFHKAFFRFAASFILFVVYSNITGWVVYFFLFPVKKIKIKKNIYFMSELLQKYY